MTRILTLLAFASIACASHANLNDHLQKRQLRAWGKRQDIVASPSALPSGITVTGSTLSADLVPASPDSTPVAVGAPRPDTNPTPLCASDGQFGSACDPTNPSTCCANGLLCRGRKCTRQCTLDSIEPSCDAANPCNAAQGYVCTANRCRPPATASRVATGSPCNQGAENSLFCLPGKAICSAQICQPCTQ